MLEKLEFVSSSLLGPREAGLEEFLCGEIGRIFFRRSPSQSVQQTTLAVDLAYVGLFALSKYLTMAILRDETDKMPQT